MRYIALGLIFLFTLQATAQRYKNPQSYYKNFSGENRKIRIKNMRYLTASLKGSDFRKVDKYRVMVLEQLKDSRMAISRVGDYQGYDVLQKEYMAALEVYIDAYENDFGVSDTLAKHRYDSYEDLKKFYEQVNIAEDKMLDAAYRLEKAEEHFAKQHLLEIERDEELEEQYRKLDEVTIYNREMTLAFFRVDAQVRSYLRAVEDNNMDTLQDIISEMRKALKISVEEVELYNEFDGNKTLYHELQDYLEEMQEELNGDLTALSEKLQNEYLEEEEYEDVQRDLERFIKRHNYRVDSFFEEQAELLEEYLPED